jgi:hypothetical protein
MILGLARTVTITTMEIASILPIATKTIVRALSTSKRIVRGMSPPLYPPAVDPQRIAALTRLPTTPSHAIIIDPA